MRTIPRDRRADGQPDLCFHAVITRYLGRIGQLSLVGLVAIPGSTAGRRLFTFVAQRPHCEIRVQQIKERLWLTRL